MCYQSEHSHFSRGKAFEGRRRDREKKRAMTEKNNDYASEKMVTSI